MVHKYTPVAMCFTDMVILPSALVPLLTTLPFVSVMVTFTGCVVLPVVIYNISCAGLGYTCMPSPAVRLPMPTGAPAFSCRLSRYSVLPSATVAVDDEVMESDATPAVSLEGKGILKGVYTAAGGSLVI